MSPTTAHAVVQRNRNSGRVLVDENVQMPKLDTRQVLVQIVNSALNPTDGEKLAQACAGPRLANPSILTSIKRNLLMVMPLGTVLYLAATLQVWLNS